jgi:hypothetical protein
MDGLHRPWPLLEDQEAKPPDGFKGEALALSEAEAIVPADLASRRVDAHVAGL